MTLPVPVPYSWVVGDAITAGRLNAFGDAINYVTSPPIAQLIQASTVQAIPNNAWTAIQWIDAAGIQVDTYGGYSSGANTRYTAQVGGWYDVGGAYSCVSNATGGRGAQIYKDGVAVKGAGTLVQAANGDITTATVAPTLVYLGVGQYVELRAFQRSGGALFTFIAADQTSRLTVCWRHA